jgi:hypothetical protein
MAFHYRKDDWAHCLGESKRLKELAEMRGRIIFTSTPASHEADRQRGLYRGSKRIWVFIPGAHSLEDFDRALVDDIIFRHTHGDSITADDWVEELRTQAALPPSGWLSVPIASLDIQQIIEETESPKETIKRQEKFLAKRDKLTEPYLVSFKGEGDLDLSFRGDFASLLIPDKKGLRISFNSGGEALYDNRCRGQLVPFTGAEILMRWGDNIFTNSGKLDVVRFDQLLTIDLPGFTVDRKLASIATQGAVWLRCRRNLEKGSLEEINSVFTREKQGKLLGRRILLIWSDPLR